MQRKVRKEKSPLGNLFDKTTQSAIGVYKLARLSSLKQCKPFCPTQLACFITNNFPRRV